MRLDKVLANMEFGSRKEVRALIKKGHVTVNDSIMKNNGAYVDVESDIIMVNNTRVQYKKHIYVMMNKASGYISATEDVNEKTVIDLLPHDMKHFKPFPVGRLDKDTEGLLLLTNDGQLAHQLTSPNKNIPKIYFARIRGVVTDKDVQSFSQGVTLDDGYVTKPAKLKILDSNDVSEIELTITEGKYHQVKRMFASQGKRVIYLKRIQIGDLVLDEMLPLGSCRELTNYELNGLPLNKK